MFVLELFTISIILSKNIPNKMDNAPIYPFSLFSFIIIIIIIIILIIIIIIIEYTRVFPFSQKRSF